MTYTGIYRNGAWELSDGGRIIGRYPHRFDEETTQTVRLSIKGRVTTLVVEDHTILRGWMVGLFAITWHRRRLPKIRWVGTTRRRLAEDHFTSSYGVELGPESDLGEAWTHDVVDEED